MQEQIDFDTLEVGDRVAVWVYGWSGRYQLLWNGTVTRLGRYSVGVESDKGERVRFSDDLWEWDRTSEMVACGVGRRLEGVKIGS